MMDKKGKKTEWRRQKAESGRQRHRSTMEILKVKKTCSERNRMGLF